MIDFKDDFLNEFHKIKLKTKIGNDQCEFCKEFFIIRGIANHKLKCPDNPKNKGKIICEKCGKLFKKTGIGRHKSCCKKNILRCKRCENTFTNTGALANHKKACYKKNTLKKKNINKV